MTTEAEAALFDFGPQEAAWRSIDDAVMGGVSSSRMEIVDGVAVFSGTVSLENNGGFASCRSAPRKHDLSAFGGVALRVRGDGKRYGLRLRTDAGFDGVNYQATLATQSGIWKEVFIPFDAFEPVYRGRRLREYPSLDPASIQTFGLIVAEKQAGPFRLEIDWIKAVPHPDR
jgi:monofunctional biosynthetic peptidoglycan transglycosylase